MKDPKTTKADTTASAITSQVDMALDPIPEWEVPEIAATESRPAFDAASNALDATQEMISGLRQKNESWLKGEIGGDVADQLRSQAALGARAGGVGTGSQMSRNLQARDFGTTSQQIQQQGMATEAALTGAQASMSQIREQRSQFMQQSLEQSRQFGASNALDQTRTQLMHKELMLKQEAFNAEQNMRLVEMINALTMGQAGLQVQAAMGDVDDSGITKAFNNLQSQLQRLQESASQWRNK